MVAPLPTATPIRPWRDSDRPAPKPPGEFRDGAETPAPIEPATDENNEFAT
jgi:hypothetical protein